MLPVLPPLVAAVVTALLIMAMLRMRARLPLDRPNARSLHNTSVPRTGGVALMTGLAAGSAVAVILGQMVVATPLLLALGLAVPSFIDDYRGLAMQWRLLFHFAAAGMFVLFMLQNEPVWLQAVLLLATVWATNLYNFMDGSDGLAGGMAVVGFGCFAWAASQAQDMTLALTCGSVAAVALAFLVFNFSPAKVFMGDAGSIPLGFLAAALGFTGWDRGHWSLWFPLLVFFPFVVDATVTLLRRQLRGERVWQAHRGHYYQRLIIMGWGHRKTALVEYALIAICGLSALALRGAATGIQWAGMVGLAGVAAVLMMWVDWRWRDYSADSEKVS